MFLSQSDLKRVHKCLCMMFKKFLCCFECLCANIICSLSCLVCTDLNKAYNMWIYLKSTKFYTSPALFSLNGWTDSWFLRVKCLLKRVNKYVLIMLVTHRITWQCLIPFCLFKFPWLKVVWVGVLFWVIACLRFKALITKGTKCDQKFVVLNGGKLWR